MIGRGIRAAWKWLDRNAGPIARGIEKAGNTVARVSRGAVKVGHAAGEIGGKLNEWGRGRRDAGGARLRRIGQGLRQFGSRANRLLDVPVSIPEITAGTPVNSTVASGH